jgi:hypothetical protein
MNEQHRHADMNEVVEKRESDKQDGNEMVIEQFSVISFLVSFLIEKKKVENMIDVCSHLKLVESKKIVAISLWPLWIGGKDSTATTCTADHFGKPNFIVEKPPVDDRHSKVENSFVQLFHNHYQFLLLLLLAVVCHLGMHSFSEIVVQHPGGQLSTELRDILCT